MPMGSATTVSISRLASIWSTEAAIGRAVRDPNIYLYSEKPCLPFCPFQRNLSNACVGEGSRAHDQD